MSQNIHASLVRAPEAPSKFSLAVKKLSMPLFLLAFAAYLGISMLGMEVPDSVDFPGPRFFPAMIIFGLLVLGVVDLLSVLNELRKPVEAHEVRNVASFSDGDPADRIHEDNVSRLDIAALIWCIAGFIFFTLTLKYLGWVIGAGILFWCVAHAFGAKKHLSSLVVGLSVGSFAYLAFSLGLGLPLPGGFLEGVL